MLAVIRVLIVEDSAADAALIESALEQARGVAGEKNVAIAGGANVVQQYLKAGLLDELQIHLAPVLLGDGVSLFDRLGIDATGLEASRVIASPSVTHLRFQVRIT
jgi:dihydrofolate reductase